MCEEGGSDSKESRTSFPSGMKVAGAGTASRSAGSDELCFWVHRMTDSDGLRGNRLKAEPGVRRAADRGEAGLARLAGPRLGGLGEEVARVADFRGADPDGFGGEAADFELEACLAGLELTAPGGFQGAEAFVPDGSTALGLGRPREAGSGER